MPIMRRKRLADGSFGPLEKVFEGETDKEKIERLEVEKTALMLAVAELGFENETSVTNLQLAVAELAALLGGEL